MAAGSNDEYHWRETYFILFDACRRPTLERLQRAVKELNRKYHVANERADEQGMFDSLTVGSPEDNAALEISYESGEVVTEQGQELAKQLRAEATPAQLRQLMEADARLDVMHFEHVVDLYGDEDEEEMLDPSCLLTVVEALVELTGGIPIDPASGAILP